MTPYYDVDNVTLFHGDAREVLPRLPDGIARTCVTSPPYFGLRDYGVDGQIGLETTPAEYVAEMVALFGDVRRVLADNGTLWVNLGDSFCASPTGRFNGGSKIFAGRDLTGHASASSIDKGKLPGIKPKDLIGIPWMTAFALRDDGWYLRSEIVWNKPACMPESVTDRPTKSHEQIFLLAKNASYYYDADAIKEPAVEGSIERLKRGVSNHHKNVNGSPGQTPHSMQRPRLNVKRGGFNGKSNELDGREAFRQFNEKRNKRTVWTVTIKPYPGAHFATYPPDLIEPCILAGSAVGDTVIDPFNGSGTTGAVCQKWGRKYIGIDLNESYLELTKRRFTQRELFGVA